MRFRWTTALLTLLVLMFAGLSSISAQDLDPDLTPNYGTLYFGSTSRIGTKDIVSGGDVSIDTFLNNATNCNGFATSSPDVVIEIMDDVESLTISFTADANQVGADTTMVVNTGLFWQCEDDVNGLNPQISFYDVSAGTTYYVWIGSYYEDEYLAGTLFAAVTQPEEPSVTYRYGVVCIRNQTLVPVIYTYRWGSGDWQTITLQPSTDRWHAYEYSSGTRSSAEFYIRFDENFTNAEYYREYLLERHASPSESCDPGHMYEFQFIDEAQTRMDLFDLEP